MPGRRSKAIRLKKVLLRTFRPHAKENRRVVVNGPKVKPVICQICLGRVKEGLEYARCTCGKEFHPACLVRTGTCPYCGASYSEGGLSEERIVRPKAPEKPKSAFAAISIIWESKEGRLCPLCGKPIPLGAGTCECGALLGDTCPEGGGILGKEDSYCGHCGPILSSSRRRATCKVNLYIHPAIPGFKDGCT